MKLAHLSRTVSSHRPASGLAGFGRTPADAMTAFDQAFYKQRTSTAIRLESMLEAKAANSQFGVGA